MVDERTGVAQSVADTEVDELELIDDIEPIEDDDNAVPDDASTGAYARHDGSEAAPSAPPQRVSSPPPVPPEARQSRPPDARSGTLPPLSRSRSHSGMFRIEHPSLPPPLPRQTAADGAVLLPVADGDELRETHAYAQRLRLTIRLREDRIRELETALREQRERADGYARELSQLRTQAATDDLTRISGIGPGFERALHVAGVSTFEQIAAWSSEDIERIAAQIRTVPQRIARGGWVERARELLAERKG